jgi:hypothetical protein
VLKLPDVISTLIVEIADVERYKLTIAFTAAEAESALEIIVLKVVVFE